MFLKALFFNVIKSWDHDIVRKGKVALVYFLHPKTPICQLIMKLQNLSPFMYTNPSYITDKTGASDPKIEYKSAPDIAIVSGRVVIY